FTTSGFDSKTAGSKTVTVTYGGKSVSYQVADRALSLSFQFPPV
ncbi:MAG: bacterial Ig-like domain-containing protein, partial [Oscillospiraceae bacterium]|nr:bacterial Ig-like domain-containing protein [Oscillospiraceae bacterium]